MSLDRGRLDRGRRMEQQNEALAIQTRGGLLGGARWFGYGLAAVTVAHFSWPLFRRQTLAIKGFLVSCSTIFGLVVGAETYLQDYERGQRMMENQIRKEARYDLARRGVIATETEIRKWRAEREAARSVESPTTPPPTVKS